ncbi:hypothetical protein JCM16303_002242 [Sporobolomyces ruberrimus]
MASSRLKRKIEVSDQGEFGNLTESFVSIGTPLPALTEHTKDKNEFKPIWQQEVYDEQGRRRLHGAFTGGFSAGYYNTVGSKEGWSPSTFKSSRSNRAGTGKREPAEAAREYMDEEDLAEMASSRKLDTNKTYGIAPSVVAPLDYDPLLGHFGAPSVASFASSRPPTQQSFDDVLSSLLQPSSSRVGSDLMRKMGWREGQGIGPRISDRQRRQQAREIGVVLETEEGDPVEEAQKHLFAPIDRPLILVEGKTASTERGWGLGYTPGSTLHAQLRRTGGTLGAGESRVSGYGVNSDPYEDGNGLAFVPTGSEGKLAVDVPEDDEVADEGPMNTGSSRRIPTKTPRTRPLYPSFTFHDQSPVLAGFAYYADAGDLPTTSALPPSPPRGWKPDPSRLWKENTGIAVDGEGMGKAAQMNPDERGALLGEQPPHALPKSVFDYLSAKSRDRLASLTGSASGASSATETPSDASRSAHEPDAQLHVPSLDRPTALAALRGFQPYSVASTSPDPVKQARYTLYLNDQASGHASTATSPFGPRRLPNGKMQTVTELNRELSEYAQSARVFKPVSGMLGNRFESSKSGSLDTPKIEPGLYQPAPKPILPPPDSSLSSLESTYGSSAATSPQVQVPKLTPTQLAAREGNFGHLTRSATQFRPTKLLCKRFGLKDPFEENGSATYDVGIGGAFGEATKTGWSTGDARASTNQPIGTAVMEEMMQSAGFKQFQEASKAMDDDEPEVAKGAFATSNGGEAVARRTSRGAAPTLGTVGMGDDESQGQEIVEEQRAPPDIFATIFADSDEDEGDDDDSGDDEVDAAQRDGNHPGQSQEEVHQLREDPGSLPADPASAAVAKSPGQGSASSTLNSLETIATLKPTFSARTTLDPSAPPTKPAKKRKAKRKVALSFDIDDGEQIETTTGKKMKTTEKKPRSRPSLNPVEPEENWEEATSSVHPSILTLEHAPPPGPAQGVQVRKPRMKAADLI